MPFKNFREESKRQFGDHIAEGWAILEEKIPANAQEEAKKEEKS